MIHVTQTYLPDQKKYFKQLKKIWRCGWITNNGELVQELEKKLKEHLNLKNFYYCNNGTIVLQMALKVLNITKEVITTPFSYVATSNAILWENCKPIFVDINSTDFNIDASLIEKHITENTQAILATHVFGNPCDIDEIERIAKKYKLKVIYDAAHSFGSIYQNRSLLSFGDISTCSFHATKIFHTAEGGGIICNDDEVDKKIYLMRQFGHIGDEYVSIGINAKASELHAAMGICILNDMKQIVEKQRTITEYYNTHLNLSKLKIPVALEGTIYNYSYYPIVFENDVVLSNVINALNKHNIYPRKYFYPSLNTLPFLKAQNSCPISESIASRIICIPLSTYLRGSQLKMIVKTINNSL